MITAILWIVGLSLLFAFVAYCGVNLLDSLKKFTVEKSLAGSKKVLQHFGYNLLFSIVALPILVLITLLIK